MTITRKKRGSGFTKHVALSLDLTRGDPAENARDLRSIFRDKAASFESILTDIEADAVAVLRRVLLPSKPGRFAIQGLKRLPLRPGEKADSVTKSVAELAKAQGEPDDSKGMFAARIVDTIRLIRVDLKAGSGANACKRALYLGQLVAESRLKSSTADGPRRGGQRAAALRWSTDEQDAKRKRYRAEVEGEMSRGFSKMKSYQKVAARNRVDIKTIRRACASGH